MEKKQVKIYKWLYPVSWLYGMDVFFRNKLFDWKILRSKSFDIPTICVGNLAVGGTGKTPHTEYLINLLHEKYAVAVLSRGYKRKTKGYIVANSQSTAQTIGDEPFQIKSKFSEVTVAVDSKRVRGIEQLMQLHNPAMNVVLLDDAFQHRYVEAGLNILLTDYHRLFCDDTLLPAGKLREPEKAKTRAHIIIVTKCPNDIKPIDFNIITKRLNLYPFQQLYFSRIKYKELIPAFRNENARKRSLSELTDTENILVVTGIASPSHIIAEINRYTSNIQTLSFPDHHNFRKKDIKKISEIFKSIKKDNSDGFIITTEKDATRFLSNPLVDEEIKRHLYVLPIEIEILQNRQETFNKNIFNYVRKNKRNGILDKK